MAEGERRETAALSAVNLVGFSSLPSLLVIPLVTLRSLGSYPRPSGRRYAPVLVTKGRSSPRSGRSPLLSLGTPVTLSAPT